MFYISDLCINHTGDSPFSSFSFNYHGGLFIFFAYFGVPYAFLAIEN